MGKFSRKVKKNNVGRFSLDTTNYWHNYYLKDGYYYFVSKTKKGESIVKVSVDTIQCLAKGESIEKNCEVFMTGWRDICMILEQRVDLMDVFTSMDNYAVTMVISFLCSGRHYGYQGCL